MKITKNMIDNIFEFAEDQAVAWLMLYELVYPNWNEIEKLDGYPQASELTNQYIMSKFIELDKKYHPDVIAGGLWMNLGFSSLNTHTLSNWQVVPCEYTLKDK